MSDNPRKSQQAAVLDRQLRKFSFSREEVPTDLVSWNGFLERVEKAYGGYEEDRYTLTRSLELSSKEMGELYERLKETSKEQLSRERDKFEAVISALGEGLALLHEDGTVLFVNPEACELLGAPKEVLKGQNFFDWISPENSEPESARKSILANEIKSFEADLHYEEKSFPVHITASIFHDTKAEMDSLVVVFREITIQREAKKLMEEQRDKAEMHSAHKTDFLASMSHEIRTPLNAIVSLVDLLLDSPLNEEQELDLHTIKDCADSLKTLINNVLDLSKIEAGKVYLDPTPSDVYAAVHKIVGQLRAIASERQVTIESLVSSDVPSSVTLDAFRLEQILTNLIGNAIKFSPKNGKISVAVRVTGDETGGKLLQFSVQDQGVGIPPERVEKIFEAFTQANNSTEKQFGGTGLGLTISAHLVQLMGGRIWVESTPGEGSTFSFTVRPVGCFEEKDTSVLSREALQGSARKSKEQKHLLLVDDNAINQNTISRMLKAKGFEVSLAENGKVATELVASESFDLVLMDLNMPVMGGLEAIQKIRTFEGEKASVPIIVLTADVLIGTEKSCLEAGANGYVTKPINYEILVEKIAGLSER